MAREKIKKGSVISANLSPLALNKLYELSKNTSLSKSEVISNLLENQEYINFNVESRLEEIRNELFTLDEQERELTRKREVLQIKKQELEDLTKQSKQIEKYLRPQIEKAVNYVVDAIKRKSNKVGIDNIALHQSRITGISPQELLNLALERIGGKK